ncbi:MAG: hypothetical protein CMQ54_02655 [Gammaproteobacteria bacterium]|nr:hypothetical protein [Gammaproteobacteria bacterium]
MNQYPFLTALVAILFVSIIGWLFSVVKKNVTIVDSLWSLFFLIVAVTFAFLESPLSNRGILVFSLVLVWSLRLSIYLTLRNSNQPEDYRYQTIRSNNQPNFELKSFYKVFILQGLLAWIISLPLYSSISSDVAINWIDLCAVILWFIGFIFEAVGDFQLSRFKLNEKKVLAQKEKLVLDTGLWRYTRHPNYFGNFCIWWSFYLFSGASGNWWYIFAPLLMTFLLLRISGVAMLEKTITNRRPGYADYIKTTNAFFPGFKGKKIK